MNISIITPAFNPGKLILETYETLKNQTYKNFEWIIVNDNSNKEHRKIIESIKEKATFPVFIINNKINLKQSRSKNIGLAHAKGKYIKFLDADDLLDTKHLENQIKLLKKQVDFNCAIFSPTVNFVNNISDSTSKNTSHKSVKNDNISQLERFLVYPFFHHCSCLFYKEHLSEIGGFNENLITDEDGDLILRLMLHNILFIPQEDSAYYYRKHDFNSRVSSNDSEEKWQARLNVCLNIDKMLVGKYHTSKEALAQRLDVLGLLSFEYSHDIANNFFLHAERVYPNYSKPGNTIPKIVRKIFGVNGYYKFKKLVKRK